MTLPMDFMSVFPCLAKDIVQEIQGLGFPQEAVDYVDRMINYTVPGGAWAHPCDHSY